MKRWKKLKKKLMSFVLMTYYTWFYYHRGIKKYWILIDSKNGKDLGSNMLRIAEELTHDAAYRKYTIFISCQKTKKKDILKMIDQYQLKRVHLIMESGFRYGKVAGLAKYLFTDTSFPIWYVKKKGQVITNTWHGTPLKMMGKDVDDRAYDMGNVQKSQISADYIIYPSDYMKQIMMSSYYFDHLFKGKVLCSGYPRNSVFFETERRVSLLHSLGLEGKKLYAYMPTWRGNLKNIDSLKITNQIEYYFAYLDSKLKEEEIFFVRLHPFVANSIDYNQYQHIKPFPDGYEPYDILNICDCLVTDYSSVMFDYANTGQKVILFVYDREVYMDERGVYVSIDSFPFPQVRTAKALLKEMRTSKNYDDYQFRKKFCQYDEKNTAKKLCLHIIKGKKQYQEEKAVNNGKENVLIYSGSLGKNGLTTALLNLLANLDVKKRNYYITFRSISLKKDPTRVKLLPKSVGIMPIAFMGGMSLGEWLAIYKYYKKNNTSPRVVKKVDRFFSRLYQRSFGYCDISAVIHYAGYEKDIINMFQQAPCKRIIFVHNDMVEEIRTKGNQHEPTLRRAYHDYDKVVPVSTDIYGPTYELGQNKENLQVVNNCHDYKLVQEKAEMPVVFESETMSTVTLEKLNQILDSKGIKFINIGRFSWEKGHEMLMKAFNRYYLEHQDSYLIIIGGYGTLYEQTVNQAELLEAKNHIVIIKSVVNPMPIMKKCNLFLLSSLYEGLGLVLLEADALGIPVISTNVPGPAGFMKEHGGYMVSPDEDGLYSGMKAFDEGKIPVMNVDYEEYNRHAIEEFENLFEGELVR